MELNDYIKKWSEKLSISEDEIKQDYTKLLQEESEIHQSLSDEDKKTRALRRLAMAYKKQLRSPAIGFEGIVIGTSDPVDIVARVRNEALTLFKDNPQKAIADGVTNEDGVPLDTRREWGSGQANKMFGRPLPEHNWLRSVYGIAVKKNIEEAPRFFTMNLSGELAKNDNVPIFKPIKFRAIDRTAPEAGDSKYTLNSSVFTKFELDESISLPKPIEMLNAYCGNNKVTMNQLGEYHTVNKDDYNRLAIVEGEVSSLNPEPTAFGSRIMTLDSGDVEDLDSPGLTCWIPLRTDIDFAEQSKVIVVGRTGQGKKRDEAGNPTEELGDVTINVFGVYAIPEFKVPLVAPEEPTKEEQPNEESW